MSWWQRRWRRARLWERLFKQPLHVMLHLSRRFPERETLRVEVSVSKELLEDRALPAEEFAEWVAGDTARAAHAAVLRRLQHG